MINVTLIKRGINLKEDKPKSLTIPNPNCLTQVPQNLVLYRSCNFLIQGYFRMTRSRSSINLPYLRNLIFTKNIGFDIDVSGSQYPIFLV